MKKTFIFTLIFCAIYSDIFSHDDLMRDAVWWEKTIAKFIITDKLKNAIVVVEHNEYVEVKFKVTAISSNEEVTSLMTQIVKKSGEPSILIRDYKPNFPRSKMVVSIRIH